MSVDPITHHCVFDVHLAMLKDKILTRFETIKQRKAWDTSAVCDLKKNPTEAKQYIIKTN